MKYPAAKSLPMTISLLAFCSIAAAQVPETPHAASLHVKQVAPREDAVLFVSPAIGGEGFSFFKAPDGTAALIPIPEVRQALEAGYKPVTVGDILDVTDNYVKTIQDQQKRFSDLASDYNALVERFNRLAAINAVPAATSYAPSQTNDEKRTMRLMLFQSLLSRTGPPPPPVQIQVTDCRTYPALCVH